MKKRLTEEGSRRMDIVDRNLKMERGNFFMNREVQIIGEQKCAGTKRKRAAKEENALMDEAVAENAKQRLTLRLPLEIPPPSHQLLNAL